jgi:hypothetical protein
MRPLNYFLLIPVACEFLYVFDTWDILQLQLINEIRDLM